MQKLIFLIAIVIGHLFVYIDSRPNFDDTGVLAVSIVIACAILAYLSQRRPWLWALAVGIWLPVHTIVHGGSLASLFTLLFAFAGAYLGIGVRWIQARAI